MSKGTGRIALALLLVAISAGPVAAVEPTVIVVGVPGPSGWPRTSLTVEIKTQAMVVPAGMGGGGTTVQLDRPTVIRVRRLPGCQAFVRFVAQPGGRYIIDFAKDGSVEVLDYTGKDLDSGPGIQLQRATCPALPDSSTAPPATGTSRLELLVLFATVLATSIVAFTNRVRSGRRLRFRASED